MLLFIIWVSASLLIQQGSVRGLGFIHMLSKPCLVCNLKLILHQDLLWWQHANLNGFYRFWNDIAGIWVSWYQTSEHSWLKIAEVKKPCVFVSLVLRTLYCSKSLFIILTGHFFLGFFLCISLPSLCADSNTVLRSSHIITFPWRITRLHGRSGCFDAVL